MVDIVFRRDQSEDLDPEDVDQNFENLKEAVEAIHIVLDGGTASSLRTVGLQVDGGNA
jgi:hypothetical protein